MIRVAVIDDHKLVQDGYKLLFKLNGIIELISCFNSGTDFFDFIKRSPFLPFDVVVVDFQMPEMNGVEIIRKINNMSLKIKTIMISHYTEFHLVESAYINGANGFLPKKADFDATIDAIQQVQETGIYVYPSIDKDHVKKLIEKQAIESKFDFTANITEREKEVAILVANGYSYKEIANELSLSTRTVEDYKDNFCRKTRASKQAGIALYSVFMGWL